MRRESELERSELGRTAPGLVAVASGHPVLSGTDAGSPLALALLDAGPPPKGSLALALGGVGTTADGAKSELTSVRAALAVLAREGGALDAATLAVVLLENDPARNAGTGSMLRLDGRSIEMDAAVMDSTGRFGAVAALPAVKNPVKVARALVDLPERVLSGEGALAFARHLGEKEFDPTTFAARRSYRSALSDLLNADGGDGILPRSLIDQYVDAGAARPAPAPPPVTDAGAEAAAAVEAGPAQVEDAGVGPPPPPADTVAVLVRDADGTYAGAVSSGGPVLALPGRVGDVPVEGAALWVGEKGAVAVSGPAASITARSLARAVYQRLERIPSAKLAAEWGLGELPKGAAAAVAVLDARGGHVASAPAVAWARGDDEDQQTSAGGKP